MVRGFEEGGNKKENEYAKKSEYKILLQKGNRMENFTSYTMERTIKFFLKILKFSCFFCGTRYA